MPELPEVETVRRGLNRLVKGHTILGTEVRWPKTVSNMTPEEFDAELTGRKIETVDRRGKYLLFRLSGDMTMVSHLRMEGPTTRFPLELNQVSMIW
ncbi:Formamidopyrimidine-DNA glycosylase [Weissella viridescens]|uniref:Formamidopyrimidine-DNA glycosylase n=1 Tax=Weissella viridescens TaxID=1629 RepID=A0A380P0Y6_WEIVI|nr:Formamidopyrimidine-DNA glycosylase [Weissella viridescens]